MALKLVYIQYNSFYVLFSIIILNANTKAKIGGGLGKRLGMSYQVGIKYSIANTYAHKAVHWYVAIHNFCRYKYTYYVPLSKLIWLPHLRFTVGIQTMGTWVEVGRWHACGR